jgi:hypothetical protein
MLVSIAGVLGIAASFGVLIYEAASERELVKEDSPTAMILGLVILGGMGLQVLSLGLGLGGILEKGRNPTRAVIGMTLSVVTLVGTGGVLLIGSVYN